MKDNQIINELISRLNVEDIWFTQKTDPTFGEAPDYFKLDEYGDLTDASVKKIVKEIKSMIGDGAVDITDAIELWVQDAMVDNKIAYRDILVTKFKDKPVVDGIEAYKNPVQLGESKSLKTENKVFNALNELNASNFVELKDEVEKLYDEEIIDDDQYDKFIDIIDEEENKCEDYLRRRNKVTSTDWKDELGIESDYVVSALQMLIAEVDGLKESKKFESLDEVPENAVIKIGVCPYCGSKLKTYNDTPEVVEYNDYVSYLWHCDKCGRDGQEIFGMEFLGHDIFQDDETDSYTEFLAKTECKEVKKEYAEYDAYIENEKALAEQYKSRVKQQITPEIVEAFNKMKNILETDDRDVGVDGAYYPARACGIILNAKKQYHLNKYMDLTLADILELIDDYDTIEAGIDVFFEDYKPDSAYSWADNYVDILKRLSKVDFDKISGLEENFNNYTKDKKEENAKRRLKEENNKSANLISQMMQEKGFDAESNAGKIILRTSALFNALSEKGYDVQVAFDNGESTSAVLLGEQGGQVLVTITDARQQLKSFASGNFEINDDNIAILNNIADIVKTI